VSHRSTSLKKSSGDCLKPAKKWYRILSKMMLFLNYCIFSGSAEALVRCGGKLQQLLIACFLGNMCAKHYENPIMLSQVTAKNVGDVFMRPCVHDDIRCWPLTPMICQHAPARHPTDEDKLWWLQLLCPWNSLPYDLRSADISLDTFKNKLKTFLFAADTH